MSQAAMQEALEALRWLRVAFKQQSQGRAVADSAIAALEAALGPEPVVWEVVDTENNVLYTSEMMNSTQER
jgi:hypothetical protein